ncbi:MAG TPA: CHAT domain-containing tetratricopeptide repeat protein, partial [Candidatus Angelobacter sp.]
ATTLGEQQWAARAKGELGIIAFLEGNSTRAVSLIGQALLSLVGTGDPAGAARLLTFLGNGYIEVRRFAEARWFFSRATSLMTNTPAAGFPYGAKVGTAVALAGEGLKDESINELESVLSKARIEKDFGQESNALCNMGEIAMKSGDLERARTYLLEAGQISKSIQLYRVQAEVMIELGNVYRSLGDLSSAEAQLNAGLEVSRKLGDRYFLPRDLTAAAELRVAQGRMRSANRLFGEAENVVGELVAHQHTNIGKTALAGAMSEPYLQHFHILQQQGNMSGAFALLERVRGTSTISVETSVEASAKSPVRARLEASIAELQRSLLQTNDQKARSELQDKLLQNERTLAFEDNERLEGTSSPTTAVSLPSTQKILRKDELLLEYVLDDPNAFCIVVTSESARVIQLRAGTREIQDLTRSYLRDLRANKSNPELATELYAILLKEIVERSYKPRLVIIADGALNFLPFEALQGPDGEFLVSSAIVSYSSSATSLATLRSQPTHSARKPLLAIGDVDYASQRIPRPTTTRSAWIPVSVLRGLAELSGSFLQNLPESRQEVLSIARVAGPNSRLLLGKEATESAFKAQALSDYSVIHLAVHAISDSRYPDRSALVLAEDKPPEDGLLQIREIVRLRLQADLVTLSACETGIGMDQGEAGVISLQRAFLLGGAKAVVASLWNVEDRSTSVLMEAFYRHLAEREDKATALAHAKRELMNTNSTASPYYWAGFVVVGEASSPAFP